jgi:hypothetical protein
MDGGHPICWAEMQAWSALTRQRLTPWDGRMLREIGDVWLKVQGEKMPGSKGGKPGGPGKPQSLREMFRSMGAKREGPGPVKGSGP